MEKQLGIKQNMLWNSMGSLINLGCQWLITVLIVRFAQGFQDAGTYSLAVSIYGIFYPIGLYRMRTYQVSDVSNENTPQEYMGLRVITCLLSLLLCMGYAALSCAPDTLPAIFFYGLYRVASLFIDVMHGCDQKNHRMDIIGQSLAIQGAASLLSFLTSYLLTRSLVASLISMTISVVLVGLFFDLPRTSAFAKLEPRIKIDKALKLLIRCFPIVAASIVAAAVPSIPRQFISNVFGNEQLGIYASVAAPVAIIQMGASYIYNPLLSYYSEAYSNRKRSTFYRLFAQTILAVILIGLICGALLSILGEDLLALVFGEDIRSHTHLMLPMIFLAVLTGFSWFMGELMTVLRNFNSVFVGNIASLTVVVATVSPCIEAWGLNGATLCSILSIFASVAIMSIAMAIQLHGYWE